jgi:hypothetical protein
MEASLENDVLLTKVKAIAQGPLGQVLSKFVDFLYSQEEYDEEPLSPEELAMVQAGLEAIKKGDQSQFIPLEELGRKLGL